MVLSTDANQKEIMINVYASDLNQYKLKLILDGGRLLHVLILMSFAIIYV